MAVGILAVRIMNMWSRRLKTLSSRAFCSVLHIIMGVSRPSLLREFTIMIMNNSMCYQVYNIIIQREGEYPTPL